MSHKSNIGVAARLLNVCVWCFQGPLRNTCGHFWLMIWEQKTRAVIMLNRVIEKGSVSSTHLPALVEMDQFTSVYCLQICEEP